MPSPASSARAAQKLRWERLANQHIAGPRARSPEELVTALGGLQAQDYASVLWSIGLRLPRGVRGEVERAFARGSVVRSWPLRGTLHVVPGADLQWMLRLTGPRTLSARRRRAEQLELTPDDFARAEKIVVAALRGGHTHTREHLLAALGRAGVATAGQRGYHLLVHLGMIGAICFGPHHGKSATFVLADEWLPAQRAPDPDEALALLAARYFTSHGPAALKDFAGWAGISLTQARTGLAGARSQLREVTPDFWSRREAPELAPHSAHLLPGFDEYVLGYKDRSAFLSSAHAAKIVPGGNGVFLPKVVVDGQVVGTWKRASGKKSVRIELSPFVALATRARGELARAAERYGAFLGLPVEGPTERAWRGSAREVREPTDRRR